MAKQITCNLEFYCKVKSAEEASIFDLTSFNLSRIKVSHILVKTNHFDITLIEFNSVKKHQV